MMLTMVLFSVTYALGGFLWVWICALAIRHGLEEDDWQEADAAMAASIACLLIPIWPVGVVLMAMIGAFLTCKGWIMRAAKGR